MGAFSELAMADLLQILAYNQKTCRVYVEVQDTDGELFFQAGEIVHARLGRLFGQEAVYTCLAASAGARFSVEANVTTDKRTVNESTPELLLEGSRRIDEGLVSQVIGGSSQSDRRSADVGSVRRRVGLRAGVVVGALIAAGTAGGVMWWSNVSARRSAPVTAQALTTEPVEAVDLTGSEDQKPRLIRGPPPFAPVEGSALSPSIACRILIGTDGKVATAQIYRPRAELAEFETIALAAVKRYVFEPGVRAGAQVPVWTNWPITFRSRPENAITRLRIKGSDTIGGTLGPALAAAFEADRTDISVDVEALGSSTGFVGLFDGSADIAASSRPVKPTEVQEASRLGIHLEEFVLGYDGIAILVHQDNPVKSLSLGEVRRLFSGKAANWAKLGGPSAAVRLVSRPSYSGTHGFFRDKILLADSTGSGFAPHTEYLEKNEEVVNAVATDPHAVTFVGLGWAREEGVKALSITRGTGTKPSPPDAATVRNGSYALSRPLLMYTRGLPRGPLAVFLRYVLSPRGQALVLEHGFVPSDADVDALIDPKLVNQLMPPFTAPDVFRVFFRHGETSINSKASLVLNRVAQMMQAGDYRARIVGHTDTVGSRADNRALSRARARNVRASLRRRGVAARLLEVHAASGSQPLESNQTRLGRRGNRRVDVTLIPGPSAAPPGAP